MKEIDFINEFKFFIYKILDICSQQKKEKNKKKIHICLETSESDIRIITVLSNLPYVVDLLFLVLLFEFGLGPLALIDKLFIKIAIVI